MIAEQYLDVNDHNGVELCVGDLRTYRGKKYKVVDWCYILERNLVEFGENDTITIDEDVAWESELVGFYHQEKINNNRKF
jgi:hypothetical protein